MQMADKIVMRSVEELIPYARNSRTHGNEQLAQLAGSIREFGFTNPVLLDGANGILAGHAQVLAARKLGMTEVPCIELGYLTRQRRAYIIADNKLALNAGWDTELLKLELEDLRLGGFDLSLGGFGGPELDALFAERTEGLTDPRRGPDTPAYPVSQPGDLWLLGRHRLLCGDSTVATDVERVLGGVQPHLMVTDPPYGVNYDPAWRNGAKFGDGRPHLGRALGAVTNDDRADWREAWALFPGDVAYIGTAASMPARFKPASRFAASPSALRSSGPKAS